MTRAEAFTLALPIIAIVTTACIGWACERYTKRHRPNKRLTLPPPSEQCRRAPDWKAQALNTRF
jgi:hypothetical protein